MNKYFSGYSLEEIFFLLKVQGIHPSDITCYNKEHSDDAIFVIDIIIKKDKVKISKLKYFIEKEQKMSFRKRQHFNIF